jgi:hypothetical protein
VGCAIVPESIVRVNVGVAVSPLVKLWTDDTRDLRSIESASVRAGIETESERRATLSERVRVGSEAETRRTGSASASV